MAKVKVFFATDLQTDSQTDRTKNQGVFVKHYGTVKGFNFAVLKVRGFLDGTFRDGFNFADYSIASYIYQQKTIDISVVK